MSLQTLFLYLIGDREATLAIAHHPHSIWIGLSFVLSAGLAREYAKTDLRRRPEVLLAPLAASWFLASVLFLLVRWCTKEVTGTALPYSFYVPFLTLFWMTGPLVWLYAFPSERVFSSIGAARVNLITLGIVSFWRVYLMYRVVHVVMGFPPTGAFFVVAFFANVIAFFGLISFQASLVDTMGGIHSLPPEENLTTKVADRLLGISRYLIVLWLGGLVVFLRIGTVEVRDVSKLQPSDATLGTELWVLAALPFVLGIVILPFTQRRQRLVTQVEDLFAEKKYQEALTLMSEHSPNDFPPDWKPPPSLAFWDFEPLVATLTLVQSQAVPRWVRHGYLQKAKQWLTPESPLDAPQALQLIESLKGIPGGDRLEQEILQSDSELAQGVREYLEKRDGDL